MLYPQKLFIEISKKKSHNELSQSEIEKLIVKNFNIVSVNVSRKTLDSRAGVCYAVSNVVNYSDLIELELSRI